MSAGQRWWKEKVEGRKVECGAWKKQRKMVGLVLVLLLWHCILLTTAQGQTQRTQRLSSRVGAVICIVRGTLEHASAALSIRGVRRERHYRGARVAREIGLPASLL